MDKIESMFYKKMQKVDFSVCGILDANNQIHTLGTDSKIIGRVFEIFTQPVLEEIASELGLELRNPSSQTIYPDFVLMEDEQSNNKIAIDIKTTYVVRDSSPIKFTLGSYTSYMRNNTKNIEYTYTQYSKHYVIGFVYKRRGSAQESKVYHYDNRDNVICPYFDVKYFIQEKYKISGDKPGSGNNENIGSFKTSNFEDLKNGKGPFRQLGHEIYDLYWKYYPKYRSTNQEYTDLDSFILWLENKTTPPVLLYAYDFENVLNKISAYKLNHSTS